MAASRLFTYVSRRLVLSGRLAVCGGVLSLPAQKAYSSHIDRYGEDSLYYYKQYLKDKPAALNKRLTSPNRFQKISERDDHSVLTLEAFKNLCRGRFFMHHRGCTFLRTPDDMVIYNELLWRLRPATVIELGTFTGGSAIWMADTLRLMEIDATIYSMDIDLSNIEERVKEIKPPNVHFIEGSSDDIEQMFPDKMLQSLPHPWLVVDDAHSNIYGLMKHFGSHMKSGDYFSIEDLHPYVPCRAGMCAVYDEYEYGGPKTVIELKEFLTDYADEYAVDSFYTDFFGYNGTWNMHGYICKL